MAAIDLLPKLVLCPLLDSYSPTLGNDVITTQYENGMPRQRLAGVGRPHQTPVSFRHKAQHQEYLIIFWRKYKARAFAMRLILDSTDLVWYECRFVGEPSISSLGADVFEFSINIVCRPKPLNIAADSEFTEVYLLTGGNITGFSNSLEHLVNYDLPESIRELKLGIDSKYATVYDMANGDVNRYTGDLQHLVNDELPDKVRSL